MKKEGVIGKRYFLSFFLSLLDVSRTPCSLAPGTGKKVGGESQKWMGRGVCCGLNSARAQETESGQVPDEIHSV